MENKRKKPVLLTEGSGSFLITEIYREDWKGGPRKTINGYPKITLKMQGLDCTGKKSDVYQDLTSKMKWTIIYLGKAVGKELYNEKKIGNIHIGLLADWDDLIGLSGACEFYNDTYKDVTTSKIMKYIPLPSGVLQYAPRVVIQTPRRGTRNQDEI